MATTVCEKSYVSVSGRNRELRTFASMAMHGLLSGGMAGKLVGPILIVKESIQYARELQKQLDENELAV